jgi:hypothetical protein
MNLQRQVFLRRLSYEISHFKRRTTTGKFVTNRSGSLRAALVYSFCRNPDLPIPFVRHVYT